MCDAVAALSEAGIQQHVVARANNLARVAQFAELNVPVTSTGFDKILRFSTDRAVREAIASFRPDVCHYWMSRAASFAPRATRKTSLGWYGGYYDVRRFKNCEWHVGMTRDIVEHIERQGVRAERLVVLNSYPRLAPSAPTSRASLNTPVVTFDHFIH